MKHLQQRCARRMNRDVRMGRVAAMENTPSLKPGGRYPATGVRAACLYQLDGIISFASAGGRRQPRWRRAPGRAFRPGLCWPRLLP